MYLFGIIGTLGIICISYLKGKVKLKISFSQKLKQNFVLGFIKTDGRYI